MRHIIGVAIGILSIPLVIGIVGGFIDRSVGLSFWRGFGNTFLIAIGAEIAVATLTLLLALAIYLLR